MVFVNGNTVGRDYWFEDQGKLITVKCDICGKEFERNESEIKRSNTNCCSQECVNKSISRQKKDWWKDKKKRVVKTCEVCEKEFKVVPSRKNAKYCSNECKGEAMKSPTRTKRQQFYASTEWEKLRRKVYKRDDYKCQMCGNGKEAGKRVAHHLDEIRENPEENWTNIDRIITLCVSCHNKIHEKFIKNNPRREK